MSIGQQKMVREASYWFGSWLAGLLILGAVQLSAVCAEPTNKTNTTALYFAPTMTVTQYQDPMGGVTFSGPVLRPIVTD